MSDPNRPNELESKFSEKKIKWKALFNRHLTLVLLVVGFLAIMLPLSVPDIEVSAAVTRAGGGYLTAVSFSTFFGIRYGFLICLGFSLLGIATFRFLRVRN